VLSFSPVDGIGTPPTLHPQASVPPSPPGSGGRGTLAGERGVGRVPIPTRGHILWYSLYIYMYFVSSHPYPNTSSMQNYEQISNTEMEFTKVFWQKS